MLDMMRKFDVDVLHRHLKNLLLSAPPRNRWIDEKDTVRDKGLYETAKGSSSGYLSDSSKESDEITALLLAGANPNGFKDEVSLIFVS
jgi:hypothetical protein